MTQKVTNILTYSTKEIIATEKAKQKTMDKELEKMDKVLQLLKAGYTKQEINKLLHSRAKTQRTVERIASRQSIDESNHKKIKPQKERTIVNDYSLSDSDFPSQIIDDYWVHASVKEQKDHPRKFKNLKIGKWLIFSEIKEIDATWQTVKKATESGLLGIGAKVATSMSNPNTTSESEKVICVYTYNWQDVDDVYRIEKALRSIGIESTLYYKTDNDSIKGNYKVNGSKNISKYISKATNSNRKFQLESLHGIGYEKIQILNSIGVKTFDDLLSFDTSKKIDGFGVSTQYINKIKLAALSQVENKIYRLRPISFPEGEIIHFDIETDLSLSYYEKKVWSVAIHHNKKVKRFFAGTWEQEKKILKDFINYIQKIENPSLYCYSGVGFDKNILASALKRHALDSDYFLNCKHYDLCNVVRQNYVMPVKSYGLKEIGKHLGYKFKNPHFDGLYVATQYIRSQKTGKKLPKEIFQYIDDDVKAMDYIIKQLQTRTDIKNTFDYK